MLTCGRPSLENSQGIWRGFLVLADRCEFDIWLADGQDHSPREACLATNKTREHKQYELDKTAQWITRFLRDLEHPSATHKRAIPAIQAD